MTRKHSAALVLIALTFVFFAAAGFGAKKKKLKPEELVAHHLEALGPAEKLKGRLNSKALGGARFQVVNDKGLLEGPATFFCEGSKLRLSMVFGIPEYPGEELAYDGEKVAVGQLSPGVRTALGKFLHQFDEIVQEGIFGGTLSTDWALMKLEERKPKLKYEGLKKVDGTKYHTLKYQRKKGWDTTTRLYFDAETFQHRHTIYKVRISAGMVRNNNLSVNTPETWYTLKESFSEFHKVGSVTLPFVWILEHTSSDGRRGMVLRWTIAYNEILNNVEFDSNEFEIDLDAY